MSDTNKKIIEEKIAGFISQPPIQAALAYLTDTLPQGAVIYLVGGALRNLIIEVFHGQRLPIDDLDLFVGGIADDISLTDIIPAAEFVVTDLGGVRWEPPGSAYDIDICRLQDFIIIKKHGLAPQLESLLDTLDFTMNAVAYDINRQHLRERYALTHIKQRIMVFNTRKLYTKIAIAYRTLLLKHKTGFVLSEDVFNFVKMSIDVDTLIAVKQILDNRIGKRKRREVLADYDDICSFGNFDDYRFHYQNRRRRT